MTNDPVLTVTPADGQATALALVLHGGRSRSHMKVRASQLAVLRMRPFATSLHRAGATHGLAVARVRYRVRGWNDAEQSPVADVRWALDRLGERFPGVPVALVGHSMGGRAAVYSAGHHSVRVVVGLAPWIEPGDPFAQLEGRRLLVAHGDQDRMTSPPESASFTRSAARVAESAAYVSIGNEKHAMLRRASLWHELATGYVMSTMCGVSPDETVGAETAKVLTKVFTGDSTIAV